MKKIKDFCPNCRTETTFRVKKRSAIDLGTRKAHLYGTITLPNKCMTCGFEIGTGQKVRTKQKRHISF